MNRSTIKQNRFLYAVFKLVANIVCKIKFKREFIRNEIKDKKGAFVVIANHAAALDFVNIIGATKRPMNFVISNSFFQTIPVPGVMPRLGLIPKQQFQTNLADLRKMKKVVDNGGILVIYPAGLMSEAGTSTPIPVATYQFLKWLGADIYMAKNIGTYFSMPKWRKGGIRTGKTYTDIYKLFDKDQLAGLDISEIKQKTDEALLFDAYEEQEKYLIKYKNGHNIEGLENVLYICPHCKKEFTIKTRDESVIYCESCGFEEKADEYQLLKKTSDIGEEIRHPSKWNEFIYKYVKERIVQGNENELCADVEIHMIPDGKKRFEKAGSGKLTLIPEKFILSGTINGEEQELSIPTTSFAALPYKPGAYIELQHRNTIYRCLPTDGKKVIKFINMVKIFYEINNSVSIK